MELRVGDCPNVIGFRRNEKFHSPRFLFEDTINWGNHKQWGGGRSVLLAAMRILFLIGFRKVYLLGVDFEMSEEKKYHFDEGRTKGAIHCNTSTYSKMMGWFAELQQTFLAENFIVKNCNPLSKLTAFPFISVDEAIYEAAGHIGDLKMERTNGMYQAFEEKIKSLQTVPVAIQVAGMAQPIQGPIQLPNLASAAGDTAVPIIIPLPYQPSPVVPTLGCDEDEDRLGD